MNQPTDGIDRRALAALMHAQGLGATNALEIDRLSGGQSNPTCRVTAGSARYVLRKQPPGPLLSCRSLEDDDRERLFDLAR